MATFRNSATSLRFCSSRSFNILRVLTTSGCWSVKRCSRPSRLCFCEAILASISGVETWIADGSHAFDEPMAAAPMRYHPELAAEAERRFVALLNDVAVAPAV